MGVSVYELEHCDEESRASVILQDKSRYLLS